MGVGVGGDGSRVVEVRACGRRRGGEVEPASALRVSGCGGGRSGGGRSGGGGNGARGWVEFLGRGCFLEEGTGDGRGLAGGEEGCSF